MQHTTRDFTVAVFVVSGDRVLLHRHHKLGLWLPPGGHIEPNELPDEAAIRETREEAGIDIQLVGPRSVIVDDPHAPLQLVRPEGIQLEDISPGHQHIDLIYFARPTGVHPGVLPIVLEGMCWIAEPDFSTIDLTNEVASWARRALASLRNAI